ncbi:MAG: hypothetical protein SH809_14280 [Rhodothermales bacterium]|nr:hypothetical protein [Rhodothermales bacterium]
MKLYFRSASLATALMLVAVAAYAQPFPHAADVSSIEGIMKAYYEVVSGPAGQPRQWARDSTLHHPSAQITIVRTVDGRPEAQVMSLGDFHKASAGIAEQGFFEYEIHRQVSQFGVTANVWSTYEWRTTQDGPLGGRGINSIQLYHDGARWWILGWMFDGRDDAGPIPPKYLPTP